MRLHTAFKPLVARRRLPPCVSLPPQPWSGRGCISSYLSLESFTLSGLLIRSDSTRGGLTYVHRWVNSPWSIPPSGSVHQVSLEVSGSAAAKGNQGCSRFFDCSRYATSSIYQPTSHDRQNAPTGPRFRPVDSRPIFLFKPYFSSHLTLPLERAGYEMEPTSRSLLKFAL